MQTELGNILQLELIQMLKFSFKSDVRITFPSRDC